MYNSLSQEPCGSFPAHLRVAPHGLRQHLATRTSVLTALLRLMPAIASAFSMHEPGRCVRGSFLAAIACEQRH